MTSVVCGEYDDDREKLSIERDRASNDKIRTVACSHLYFLYSFIRCYEQYSCARPMHACIIRFSDCEKKKINQKIESNNAEFGLCFEFFLIVLFFDEIGNQSEIIEMNDVLPQQHDHAVACNNNKKGSSSTLFTSAIISASL
mmetsp:Transcript_86593/g.176138  ORF Transcript_86593/g.176138 Transcript_86593/m.176138 type:complete len:142 (+) Transcript_86593:577-1002(+)